MKDFQHRAKIALYFQTCPIKTLKPSSNNIKLVFIFVFALKYVYPRNVFINIEFN